MKLPMPGAAAAIPTAMNPARAAPGRATQTKQAASGQTAIRRLRIAGAGSPACCLDAEG